MLYKLIIGMCVYARVFSTLSYTMYVFELFIRSTKHNYDILIITILETRDLAVGI